MRVAELDDADELAFGVCFKLMELIEERLEGVGVFDTGFCVGERVQDTTGDYFATAQGGQCGWAKRDWCRGGSWSDASC